LNDHDLWKPRGTTVDLSTGNAPLLPQFGNVDNAEQLGDARDFDGDHVLIEFLEGDTQQAFVRADQLPHPRSTFRMELAQGDRQRSRFRGVIQETDDKGNWTLDATRANDGKPDPTEDGQETPAVSNSALSDAEKSAFGNVTLKASNKSEFNVLGVDDNDGDEQFRLRMKANELLTQLGGDITLLLTGNQGNANMTVGDGAVSAAIAEHLATLWGLLDSYLDVHVHPEASLRSFLATAGVALSAAGVDPTLISIAPLAAASLATAGTALTSAGASVPDAPSTSAPNYDTAITSTKVTIPDG
jgi:hypothetical protein